MEERQEFLILISSGTDFLRAAGEVFASLSLSKTENTTSSPCLRHSKDNHCLSTKHPCNRAGYPCRKTLGPAGHNEHHEHTSEKS